MQAHKQQTYLRALATNPKIIIHKGKFRADPRVMPIYPWEFDENGNPTMVKVRKTEEKGSDVNLATYFLFDIFTDKADAYVVLTNDSDLAEPIRLARHELGQTVGLILSTETPSKDLLRVDLQIVRQIREGVLIASQLPDVLIDKHGTIKKTRSLVKAETPTEAGGSRPAA